jgi:hypothetical protein
MAVFSQIAPVERSGNAPAGELLTVSFITTRMVIKFTLVMTGRAGRMVAPEAFMPISPVATMVLIEKLLVITLTDAMAAPIRILLPKTLPVMGIVFVPDIPFRLIPLMRPDNIGRRISVIRSPAILIAEKVIQYSI